MTAADDLGPNPVHPMQQAEVPFQQSAEQSQPVQQQFQEQPLTHQQPVQQPASQQPTQPAAGLTSVKQEVPIALEHALIRTLAMLQQHNLASAEDCSQVAASVRRNWEAGKGGDPIDFLARLRSGGGEMLDASVEMISVKLAHSMAFVPSRVSFASSLIPPTSFYDKHPEMALYSKLMRVPVAFAEDEDVIGLASINPYFSDAFAHILCEKFKRENGIQPIVNIIRVDYIGWMKMCLKHFKEGGES